MANEVPRVVPLKARVGNEEVLNGIALDGETGRLLLTGKLWHRSFYVEVDVS